MVICTQKVYSKGLMLFKLPHMAGSSLFVKKSFLEMQKLDVIYLLNVFVVILENHTRYHWLCKGLQNFCITKPMTTLTSSCLQCHSNFETVEGDEIKRQSSNFVTLRKNKILMTSNCQRQNQLQQNTKTSSVQISIPEQIMG